MIMFCDIFFDSPQMKHMHKVIEDGDKGNTNITQYSTHEGAMIHEFMHVDMFIDVADHSKPPEFPTLDDPNTNLDQS
jgi:hypothetical protein